MGLFESPRIWLRVRVGFSRRGGGERGGWHHQGEYFREKEDRKIYNWRLLQALCRQHFIIRALSRGVSQQWKAWILWGVLECNSGSETSHPPELFCSYSRYTCIVTALSEFTTRLFFCLFFSGFVLYQPAGVIKAVIEIFAAGGGGEGGGGIV